MASAAATSQKALTASTIAISPAWLPMEGTCSGGGKVEHLSPRHWFTWPPAKTRITARAIGANTRTAEMRIRDHPARPWVMAGSMSIGAP